MTLNIYYNHETGSAEGSLFWDDGESDFEDESGALKSNILLMNYELRNSEISASCFSPEGHSDSGCYFSLGPENNNDLEKIRIIGIEDFSASLNGDSLTVQDAIDTPNAKDIILNGVKINDEWKIILEF